VDTSYTLHGRAGRALTAGNFAQAADLYKRAATEREFDDDANSRPCGAPTYVCILRRRNASDGHLNCRHRVNALGGSGDVKV